MRTSTKKWVLLAALLALAFASGAALSAHGGEEHKKKAPQNALSRELAKEARPKDGGTAKKARQPNELSLEQFPSLHPLVVHFPIVFLLLAPGLWLLAMLTKERNVYRIAFVIALFGLLGALIAGSLVHPHTIDLWPEARDVLEKHDFWAEITIQSALASLILMGGALWITRFEKYLKILALSVSLLAALAVSLAGHYGATLTHVHGIGPQGKFLDIDARHKD